MNNSQFRNLVNNTPRVDRSSGSGNATSSASTAAPLLGSRQRSSIPMTPRSVGFNSSSSSNSFAQQAAAYRLQQNPPKEKKFRSSAPLGSKLPQGYVDRTKLRDDDDTTTAKDAEQRMAALMKLVEEGALTREEAIEQSKAFGGDAGSTHLVKGLDFKLLERARKGEDVLAGGKQDEEEADEEDVEDELDKALEKKVEAVKRERKEEKDDDEDVPKVKTRAEILAEWKKSREEAAAKKAAETSLGSKFKKFGEKEKKIRGSKDDKSGSKKADTSGKKRKRDKEASHKETTVGNGTVLGMLPPDLPSTKAATADEKKVEEDEDVNIFDDAPDDYDPLAGLEDSDDSDSDEGEVEDKSDKKKETMAAPPPPSNRPRNYFATSSKDPEATTSSIASTPLSGQDLANTIELSAAIKKAAQMRDISKADLDDEERKKEARHKAMLQAASRDDEDVDMGFGGSRTFGDEDDDDLGPTAKKKRKSKKHA